MLGDFRKAWWSLGGQDPRVGAHCSGCRINSSWEPLLWCQVHGSCRCVCLPWLKERRRWSSRRNGGLLSSYGQTEPPFSVPKQHLCPCRASQLELGKLRVADRARKGFGQGQTEDHDCVCCSFSGVEVRAPALLGWQWTLLPAWVTKRAGGLGSTSWHMEEEAGDPGGQNSHQTQPGRSTVPMAAPSVRLSVHPGPQPGRAGRLAVMVCVCVVPLMTTREILHYIQTNTLGFVTLLLNTAKHSSNRTRRSRGSSEPRWGRGAGAWKRIPEANDGGRRWARIHVTVSIYKPPGREHRGRVPGQAPAKLP